MDAVVAAGARFSHVSEGVEFWVVPVVEFGSPDCASANAACVVGFTPDERASAECVLLDERPRDAIRLEPLLPGHAAVYGIVPDDASGVRVTSGGLTTVVQARDNVIGAVLPFPYHDTMDARVVTIRQPALSPPRVGVVGAGRRARDAADRIRTAGYEVLGGITPGANRKRGAVVYWRPEGARRAEAAAVAAAVGARAPIAITRRARTPRLVLDTAALIVVVAGR